MMKLCNDTITVFNKRVKDGAYVYIPTVINGVSWYGDVATSVGDKGLNAANRFTIRVPLDADFGGKSYADPISYSEAMSSDGIFTFANGDILVKESVAVAPMTPAELKEAFIDYCTVLGVTDNRRAPNAPHWKLVGS